VLFGLVADHSPALYCQPVIRLLTLTLLNPSTSVI
jgi:hypothetical protein